jgi:hypothetical protein
MSRLTCVDVRRQLAAYHDRELAVGEMIAVEGHLDACGACTSEARALAEIGDALRTVARTRAEDLSGLQPGILSRLRAERAESFTARTGRLFEDMHLVWASLAATAGTLACAAVALGVLSFAPAEREDSLSAMLTSHSAAALKVSETIMPATLAWPLNSGDPLPLTSAIRVPTLPDPYGIVPATLAQTMLEEDLRLALSAVITRDGRVTGVEVLSREAGEREVLALLDALSRARLQPASFAGSPVPVNTIWLFTAMTVRGDKTRS